MRSLTTWEFSSVKTRVASLSRPVREVEPNAIRKYSHLLWLDAIVMQWTVAEISSMSVLIPVMASLHFSARLSHQVGHVGIRIPYWSIHLLLFHFPTHCLLHFHHFITHC
jgi:hypothetical protein